MEILAAIPVADHPAPIRPDAQVVQCRDCRQPCWLGPRQLKLYPGWPAICPACLAKMVQSGDTLAMTNLGG